MIMIVAAATAWFGVTFGPVRGVSADIYTKLASTQMGNPDPSGKLLTSGVA